MPGSTQAQASSSGLHAGLGLGWGFPLGNVSTLTDVVTFSPSLPADDVYYRTLTFHIALGVHEYPWLGEISIDGGLARLTPDAHAAINAARPDGRRAHVEDFSFELFGARMVRVPYFGRDRLSLFGGAGIGFANLSLVSKNGYEPEHDEGLGASAKAGVQLDMGGAALRVVGRYQLVTLGVELPRELSVSVMMLAWGVG